MPVALPLRANKRLLSLIMEQSMSFSLIQYPFDPPNKILSQSSGRIALTSRFRHPHSNGLSRVRHDRWEFPSVLSRWLSESIVVGLVTALFVWVLSLTPMIDRVENQYGLGILYSLRGPVKPPEGAIIIAIDRKTIAWLRHVAEDDSEGGAAGFSCLPEDARKELSDIRGPGSLPRSVHGCLIKQLSVLGFPVIVFDILFAMEGTDNDDTMFAQAIEEHGATAILVGIERLTVRNGASELLVERQVKPIASFAKSAAATGTFIVPRSGGPVYGYWRRIPGFKETRPLPDQAFDLYSSNSNEGSIDDKDKPGFEYLWLYGPPGSITIVSASEILSDEIPESVRMAAPASAAFVGASDPTMTNFLDTFPSFFRGPSGAGISGVELASTAFLNLKNGELLHPLSPNSKSMAIIFFAFALGFIARAWSGIAIPAVPMATAIYLAIATFAFAEMRLSLPIASPIFIAAPVAFLLAVLVRYRIARALLVRLAPAAVARRMMTRETDHRSDVVSDEATVVFFDLIGSTDIADKITPIEFSTLLNNYYDTVTSFVEMQHGQITAFSGDGVMAVFTQIDAGADHAVSACKAVIKVIRGFRDFNAKSEKSGMPALHLRIGLNSGGVAEGEIGARDRFNFSVVGDVVNMASRLEQLGKTIFPGKPNVILVGEATRQLAEGQGLPFVDCGCHRIRGRANPEQVYQLLVD